MFSELNQNIDEAEQLLNRALEIEPNNAAFLDSLGWIYYREGKYDLALKKIQHAANQLPSDAVILEHLGDVYIALENVRKALEYWQKSNKANPKEKKVIEKILKHGGSVTPTLKKM